MIHCLSEIKFFWTSYILYRPLYQSVSYKAVKDFWEPPVCQTHLLSSGHSYSFSQDRSSFYVLLSICLSSLVRCLFEFFLIVTGWFVCGWWEEFFIYSGYKSFARYMYCKYFPSLWFAYSFYFKVLFDELKFLNMRKSNKLLFSFMVNAF